ncbi:MAG: PGPGW domain-containing protein [Myxococcales bacterium]|nr:PGPGW domain-containing protein [Myxococcales bacterium]
MVRRALVRSYTIARRIVVTVVGTTVVLFGIAMIALPGPAVLVIPLGLAILGLEFAWARRWLHHLKQRTHDAANQLRGTRGP